MRSLSQCGPIFILFSFIYWLAVKFKFLFHLLFYTNHGIAKSGVREPLEGSHARFEPFPRYVNRHCVEIRFVLIGVHLKYKHWVRNVNGPWDWVLGLKCELFTEDWGLDFELFMRWYLKTQGQNVDFSCDTDGFLDVGPKVTRFMRWSLGANLAAVSHYRARKSSKQ